MNSVTECLEELTLCLDEARLHKFLDKVLTAHAKEDQAERWKYQNNYKPKNEKSAKAWGQAAKKFAADNKRAPDDIFGDKARHAVTVPLVTKHIKTIVKHPKLLNKAWLLAQHADHDVKFQKHVLRHLPKDTEHYKYLHDRVSGNTGKPQKYGTQDRETTET